MGRFHSLSAIRPRGVIKIQYNFSSAGSSVIAVTEEAENNILNFIDVAISRWLSIIFVFSHLCKVSFPAKCWKNQTRECGHLSKSQLERAGGDEQLLRWNQRRKPAVNRTWGTPRQEWQMEMGGDGSSAFFPLLQPRSQAWKRTISVLTNSLRKEILIFRHPRFLPVGPWRVLFYFLGDLKAATNNC